MCTQIGPVTNRGTCKASEPVLAIGHSNSCNLTVITEPTPRLVFMETLSDGELQWLEATVVLKTVLCLLEHKPNERLFGNLVLGREAK